MKNKIIPMLVMLVTGILASTASSANEIKDDPGYVEFSSLESVYGEPKVLVNLNKLMLGFVAKLNANDPEVGTLIEDLEAVFIYIYDISNNSAPALDMINQVSREIRGDNWMPIVEVNEEDEKVRIMAKFTDDIMDGLVAMVIDTGHEGEAVFINIVGQIDPTKIEKVTESLSIDLDLN